MNSLSLGGRGRRIPAVTSMVDPLTLADEAEERSAADALRAAKSRDELTEAWFVSCEQFEGDARIRLQDVHDAQFVKFTPYTRAG